MSLASGHMHEPRARKLVAYMGHPVAAPSPAGIVANLANARAWLHWLRTNTAWSVNAHWIAGVQAAMEAGVSEPEERERGLEDCLAIVERCDLIVLVGGRVSSGMAVERTHAIEHGVEVLDLSMYGVAPPEPGSAVEMLVRGCIRRSQRVHASEETQR